MLGKIILQLIFSALCMASKWHGCWYIFWTLILRAVCGVLKFRRASWRSDPKLYYFRSLSRIYFIFAARFFRFRASLVVIGEISQLIKLPVIRPTFLNYILANSPHWTRYKTSRVWTVYRSDDTYVQDTLPTVVSVGYGARIWKLDFGKYFHKYRVRAIEKFYRKERKDANLT